MRKLGKLTVCTLSVLAHPAISQENTSEPADDVRGLEEVVVTAQKRAENAQDVPIAISALTASAAGPDVCYCMCSFFTDAMLSATVSADGCSMNGTMSISVQRACGQFGFDSCTVDYTFTATRN